jgi:hypothetical protein
VLVFYFVENHGFFKEDYRIIFLLSVSSCACAASGDAQLASTTPSHRTRPVIGRSKSYTDRSAEKPALGNEGAMVAHPTAPGKVIHPEVAAIRAKAMADKLRRAAVEQEVELRRSRAAARTTNDGFFSRITEQVILIFNEVSCKSFYFYGVDPACE